ncbi:MAG: putative partition-related protein [Schlesneria sp.]|nr:putative partition-related protein [Schlesneria sp.]
MLSMKNLVWIVLLATVSSTFADAPRVLEEIKGEVLGVIDGDTVTLHTTGKPLSIRLEGIDAPESSQRLGAESRDALKALVAGKSVTVRKTGIDKYGRTLGIVVVNGTNVCAKMVENGWAWHFKKYNSDELLAKLELQARDAKRGVWQDQQPLAPWDYRRQKEEEKIVKASPPPATLAPVPPVAPIKAKPVTPAVTPSDDSHAGMVWVNGYTRKNGTQVKGYWRRK